ncbi:MAG TPA: penicillin-binding protein 2 [Gammaproteobacteria bacterium]|nr:penicillin-binding protein 2 [Gammaproteobacteria bacterium]
MRSRTSIKDEWREVRLFQNRVLLAVLLMFLMLLGLLVRLYWLQVERHPHYATLSEGNRVRIQTLAPNRGLIYDRNGILLAENVPNYQLELVPEQVQDIDETLQRLAEIIHLRPADIEQFEKLRRTKRRFEPVPLRYNLSDEEVARFAVHRQDFPGVDIEARLTRRYPLGQITAHVVGYTGAITERELAERDAARYSGTSQIGKTGVERSYEDRLHGYPGIQQVETNAQSRVLRVLDTTPPVPGSDITLNIDVRLQKAAYDALGDYKGAVVAIDPRNGEVLALVSKPSFNPNLFVQGIDARTFNELQSDARRPLFNRALAGTYPPGSTIKPLVALAGLHYGVVTSTHSTFCNGRFILPGNPRPYRDWKRTGHGPTTMRSAIAESCDVYFYELAVELGVDRIHEFLGWFDLGRVTGIDLPGENGGLLPSREWKQRARREPWYPGETVNLGIGQGFMLTTPLQLAQSTARLANRGRAFLPRVVRGVHDPLDPEMTALPPVALPDYTARGEWHWVHISQSMQDVMHGRTGTARAAARGTPYRIAGKTGTAQVFTLAAEQEYNAEEIAATLRDHALFVAFAPADDPQLVLAVVVENGGGGSSVAAPMARQIFDAWLLPQETVAP